MDMKKLNDLKRGESAVIKAVHGETVTVSRLHSLGFLPGRLVRHANTAPLGDPVAYEIDGQKVSMRRMDSGCVEIGAPE